VHNTKKIYDNIYPPYFSEPFSKRVAPTGHIPGHLKNIRGNCGHGSKLKTIASIPIAIGTVMR